MIYAVALYAFISMPVIGLDSFHEDGSMNVQTEPTSIVWFETCTTDDVCESLFE